MFLPIKIQEKNCKSRNDYISREKFKLLIQKMNRNSKENVVQEKIQEMTHNSSDKIDLTPNQY